ncbi:MAG: hypothetical protein NC418_00700 [Muribaculaceae bacterium]|nr:hypothetical protein [Muribaculaceae bacterium]
MTKQKEDLAGHIIVVLIVAVTAIGAVVWACRAPWAYDDWYYRLTVNPELTIDSNVNPGIDPEVTTLGEALTSIRNHFSYNGRLANFIHILFQPAGHTVEAVCMGACVALMLLCFCAFARKSGRLPSALGAMLCALLLWVQYPWVEGMVAMSYLMNYIPPAVLLLALVLWHGRYAGGSRAVKVGLWLLAFAASWSNEGNGAVLCVFFAVSAMLSRGRLRASSLVLLSALLAGLALNLILGTGGRAVSQLSTAWALPAFWLAFAEELWPIVLATAAAAVKVWRSKARGAELKGLLPALCAMYAGIVPGVLLCRGERVLWSAYLFASVILIVSLRDFTSRRGVWRQVVIPGAFVIVYALWMGELCRWQLLVGRETAMIEERFGGRNGAGASVVYGKHVANNDIPYWLMGVVHNPLDTQWGTIMMGLFLSPEMAAPMVLPPDLDGVHFADWPRVPGNSGWRGAWPMVGDTAEPRDIFLMATFGPARAQSPLERLLTYIKYGERADTIAVGLHFVCNRATMADSTEIYRMTPEHLPRTARHRPLLRLDTLQ